MTCYRATVARGETRATGKFIKMSDIYVCDKNPNSKEDSNFEFGFEFRKSISNSDSNSDLNFEFKEDSPRGFVFIEICSLVARENRLAGNGC